ncbi:TniB family NTP-binding protein [Noviherbaspirillum sp.]|jgi:hypothetical protein|uniref:TniB family NTP-binding protein n=1 Tax=Noviherbaspirillum sp. TaxID=1926288 RepID=UPI0025D334E8|nr:TniB family NTP-binding protein [Noviherbaspirillum sp.]
MNIVSFDATFYRKLKAVEDLLIPHPNFDLAVSRLRRTIELSRNGAEPRHMLLVGESGTGKTWLAQYLSSLYLPRIDNASKANTVIPILLVNTPSIPTLKGLAEAILIALGDPLYYRGTASDKRQRALELLMKCEVKFIVIDEFQHFLDHGKYNSLTSVTDWLKRFIDDANTPCLLMGLPRCEEILQANEQLRRRFSTKLKLPVFSIDTHAGECEFRGILKQIDRSLPTEHLSGLAEIDLARRLYFASNGLLGYLRKLITGAFELMVSENSTAINVYLLEQAFTEVIWQEGRKMLNPFNPAFQFRRLNRIGEPFAIAAMPKKATENRAA